MSTRLLVHPQCCYIELQSVPRSRQLLSLTGENRVWTEDIQQQVELFVKLVLLGIFPPTWCPSNFSPFFYLIEMVYPSPLNLFDCSDGFYHMLVSLLASPTKQLQNYTHHSSDTNSLITQIESMLGQILIACFQSTTTMKWDFSSNCSLAIPIVGVNCHYRYMVIITIVIRIKKHAIKDLIKCHYNLILLW